MTPFLTMLALIVLLNSSCGEDFISDAGGISPNATFSSIQTNVLTQNCASSSCHGGTINPNMTASAYSRLVNTASSQSVAYITPGDPSNSYLYQKLLGSANIVGARMPKGRAALASATMDSIRAWIMAGALNN